jgi:hypothetical protein
MEVQRDFSEFLALLNAARVEYLVVGAYALAFHGAPRNTLDLDIYLRPTSTNAVRFMTALQRFGFGSLSLHAKDVTVPNRILQLGRTPVRIDVMTSISGVRWQAAWRGRVSGQYGEVPVPFLGRTQLLANKRASGRAKDLGDIEALTRRPRRHQQLRKKKR